MDSKVHFLAHRANRVICAWMGHIFDMCVAANG
jgi:hypothetical protein